MRRTLPNVSSKFGAPMGRSSHIPEIGASPVNLFVQKLEWVDGDYDQGGAYWGAGTSLGDVWWAHGDFGDDIVHAFVRGRRLLDAKQAILRLVPTALFDGGPELDAMVDSYVKCALWSSTDDDDNPLDENRGLDDVDPATMAKMRSDCESFLASNASDIGLDYEQAGHDLWLTRNGHGAGFWDGDWPEAAGKRLTAASKALGEVNLYVGDDSRIHQ